MRKRDLVGRKIVEVDWGRFPDGRGGWAHDPTLVLDNGRCVRFVTEETEGCEYGTAIVISPPVAKGDR